MKEVRKSTLLVIDKSILALCIILLGLVRPDALVMTIFLVLPFYLILTKRKVGIKQLLVSFLVALGWMLFSNSQYGYNLDIASLAGINLYPLFAWSTGLFAVYLVYSHWEETLKNKTHLNKFLLFTLIYVFLLITVETLAYHVFGIVNLTTGTYPGLPICDCIHAPRWMQISYFLLGPIYFTICEFLKLENPHKNLR